MCIAHVHNWEQSFSVVSEVRAVSHFYLKFTCLARLAGCIQSRRYKCAPSYKLSYPGSEGSAQLCFW